MALTLPRRIAIAAALASLSACATYHRAPLPRTSDLGAGVGALKVDVARLRVAPLRAVVIDPAKGFSPLDVAVLAVLNSPELTAKRAALGVSAAQVFAAGLLPDPQLTASVDKPIAGPDTHTAFSISPSIDIAAVIQRASAARAARFQAKQANLEVLWAEWTTAQQARLLAVTAMADEARAGFLRHILAAAVVRADRAMAVSKRGDIAGPAAAADVAAKLDLETQVASTQHDAQKARRDLNGLLGLDAAVALPLRAVPPSAGYDEADVRRALADLPARRPDLLALQAGYGAQDANLRKAILAQFPLAQIAFAYARDPANTTTIGLSAVSALPIFNGHRGEVRVQEATRAQLRAEYQARLDQTDAEVKNAAAELTGARRMAALLRADLPALLKVFAPAPAALARGDIDSAAYLTLLQATIGKQADLEDKELVERTAEIQLETALFLPPAALAVRS